MISLHRQPPWLPTTAKDDEVPATGQALVIKSCLQLIDQETALGFAGAAVGNRDGAAAEHPARVFRFEWRFRAPGSSGRP